MPQGAQRAWVHVRAVGGQGIVGEWSPARPVRAAQYELPAGAFVAQDGVVVLPDGATVRVNNGDGLDVAYENVTSVARSFSVPLYWGKLSGPLHLAEDMPVRIVHLRDPALAGAGEARLVLARRQLAANVELSPANARWPSDPIEARIDVRDPSGRIDAAGERVTVEAMLDLTPLDVSWEHHGSSWRGRIAPRLIGGNSVVRVLVKDGQGTEIGRGFVELAPTTAR